MKKNILNSLIVLSMLTFSACKVKKQLVVAPPVQVENTAGLNKTEVLKSLSEKQFKFNTLAIRAKANLDVDGNANDVTMVMRIKNEDTIWAIVSAGGGIIEVARVLITPDSIQILNKLSSEYIKKPFSYVQNFTNKEVDFNMLQSILTGNVVKTFLTENVEIKNNEGVQEVKGSNNDLDFRMLFNTILKVSELNLNDVKNAQALKVNYNQYQTVNNALFPSSLKLSTMAKQKTIILNLDVTKVDVDIPVEFPFTVNKRFKVIE